MWNSSVKQAKEVVQKNTGMLLVAASEVRIARITPNLIPQLMHAVLPAVIHASSKTLKSNRSSISYA